MTLSELWEKIAELSRYPVDNDESAVFFVALDDLNGRVKTLEARMDAVCKEVFHHV